MPLIGMAALGDLELKRTSTASSCQASTAYPPHCLPLTTYRPPATHDLPPTIYCLCYNDRTTMADSDLTHRTIDPFSRDVLEFPAVIELLHSYLSGPISEPLLERVEPHTHLEKIRRDLELAREAREYLRESARPSLAALCEPSPLLEKLRVEGLALAALEILALVEVARAGLDMYRTFAQGAAPRGGQHEDAGANAGGRW